MTSLHFVDIVELPIDSFEEAAPVRPQVIEEYDPRTTFYLLDILAAAQEEEMERERSALQHALLAKELEELEALLEEEAVLDALGARLYGLSGYALPSYFLNPFASTSKRASSSRSHAMLPSSSAYAGTKRSASTAFYAPSHTHYYIDAEEVDDDWLGSELLIGRMPGTQCWVIDLDPQESCESSVPYEVFESATPVHRPDEDDYDDDEGAGEGAGAGAEPPAPAPAPVSTATQAAPLGAYRAPTVADEDDADAGVRTGPPRKLARMEE